MAVPKLPMLPPAGLAVPLMDTTASLAPTQLSQASLDAARAQMPPIMKNKLLCRVRLAEISLA